MKSLLKGVVYNKNMKNFPSVRSVELECFERAGAVKESHQGGFPFLFALPAVILAWI